ncbi:hypothetical protein PTKIN_Ptkin16aG0005600 [Pterospermum kingtungense]
MQILSWNIRGLGRKEKQQAVKRKLVEGKFNFLMLQETKVRSTNSRLFRWIWGRRLFNGVVVCSNGNFRGLILGWNENVFEVEHKVEANRFILIVGTFKSINYRCGIGTVYALNDDAEQVLFWEELAVAMNL